MIRSHSVLLVSAVVLLACRHHAPEPTLPLATQGASTTCFIGAGRMAYQINHEPPIIMTECSKRPLKYHGRWTNPDEIVAINVLKAPEARERFKDQSLSGALLIDLKPLRYDPAVHR